MISLHKLFVAAALSGLAGLAPAAGYSGLYIFGDSLSDAGNIALAIGANPNQVVTDNSYIPSQPYASGQFTNGNVWAKSFAASLGFGSAGLPSGAGGSNYAFGGARTVADGTGLPPSVTSQVTNLFLAANGAAPGGALYIVEGGGNDARDALQAAAGSATPGNVIAVAAASYAQATGAIVDDLQAHGAQHIVVWDVPNLALAPAVNALGASASFLGGQVSLAMNSALSARLSTESGVSIFDVFGLENAFVAHPSAYGLVNVTDACGAIATCDPSKFLFWCRTRK